MQYDFTVWSGVVHAFHAIHAEVYAKIASKGKNNIGIHLTDSGFTELGRAAERFTDPDLHDTTMKPDNKKRRSKKRRPAGHCGGRERKRIVKAEKLEGNVRRAGKWAGEYTKARPERKRLKTAIMPGIVTKRYGFPLRGTMSEPYYGRGSRKAAGLKDVPSKSRPRKWPKRAPVHLLDGLIPFAAGKAACGSFPADTTRLRFNRHVLADHAKGERRVADTRKRHAPISPDGKAPASTATDGDGADATTFGKLCTEMPDGSGASPGDGACRSLTNCKAVIVKGRDPYFEPEKSCNGKGTDAWAETVELWKERPGRFYKVYKARTTIEAAFSATKGRFACCVRAVTIPVRERELAIVSTCPTSGPDGPWGVKITRRSPIVGEAVRRLPIWPVSDDFGRFPPGRGGNARPPDAQTAFCGPAGVPRMPPTGGFSNCMSHPQKTVDNPPPPPRAVAPT